MSVHSTPLTLNPVQLLFMSPLTVSRGSLKHVEQVSDPGQDVDPHGGVGVQQVLIAQVETLHRYRTRGVSGSVIRGYLLMTFI